MTQEDDAPALTPANKTLIGSMTCGDVQPGYFHSLSLCSYTSLWFSRLSFLYLVSSFTPLFSSLCTFLPVVCHLPPFAPRLIYLSVQQLLFITTRAFFSLHLTLIISLSPSVWASLALQKTRKRQVGWKRGKENAAVITLSLHLRKAKYLNYKRVKEERSQEGGRNDEAEEKESEWQVRELLKCL